MPRLAQLLAIRTETKLVCASSQKLGFESVLPCHDTVLISGTLEPSSMMAKNGIAERRGLVMSRDTAFNIFALLVGALVPLALVIVVFIL